MTFQAIGHALLGAGVTAAAGVSGAATGYLLDPHGYVSVAVGAVTAIAAAMAWVDKRIDRRLVEYGALESARAEARDATLLHKVEEMLKRE